MGFGKGGREIGCPNYYADNLYGCHELYKCMGATNYKNSENKVSALVYFLYKTHHRGFWVYVYIYMNIYIDIDMYVCCMYV